MPGLSPARKTILITGATSGIGRAVALKLSGLGVHLALVGRNEKAGERLARQVSSGSRGTDTRYFRGDLSDLKDVRCLASRLKDSYEQVDVLINNAGARFSNFEETSEGLERTFATNHLGHFLLTALLIEHLLRARKGRIITVGSGAHAGIRSEPPWTLTAETYDRKLAYAASKLANTVFSFELARRLHNTTVSSNVVDPGGVATNLGRNNGWVSWCRHLGYYALRGRLITASRAADSIVSLALDQGFEGVTGEYFNEGKSVPSSALSRDPDTARRLWRLSVKLSGLDVSTGRARDYFG